MHDLLLHLNEKQREAVTATSGPLLVIAGAGSGKTRALTHRIAYLMAEKKVNPWNIFAVTFTNKAAQEMKERVMKLISEQTGQTSGNFLGRTNEFSFFSPDVPTIGTFHSMCARILRKNGHFLDFENSFTIYDGTDQEILMKHLMEERKMDPKRMNPRSILSGISSAKNQLIGPKEYLQYANTHFTEKVAELYEPYQKALRLNGAMDFDDLIMKTVELFRREASVLQEYQDRFQFISVDEYQDTNHAQYIFVKLLAQKYKNVCVIGDEDQSIYSWRGATIQNILAFEKDYPNAKVVKLEQNYRSSQQILDSAHSVISLNNRRKDKRLWSEKTDGEKVCIWAARNERSEGDMVASEILRLLQRYELPDYRDFVVLYRTNAQSRVMEEVFLRHGIPYKIIGGIQFYERKEIKDLIAYLRVIQNPRDSVSLLRILNVPARNIGVKTVEALQRFASGKGSSLFEAMEEVATFDTAESATELSDAKIVSLQKFTALIRRLQEVNVNETAAGVIKYVLEESGYKGFLDDGTSEGEERLENVRELISVAKKYDSLETGMSLKVFLEEVSLISDVDLISESANSVTMMTVHSAKGLEFTNVFVVGLEEGIFPHGRNVLERDQLEEERRLMYVALTRAKERLYLLFAQERLLYGEYRNNAPSQFLEVLPEKVCERNYSVEDSDGFSRLSRGARGARGASSGGGNFIGANPYDRSVKNSLKASRMAEMKKPVPMENVESAYRDGDRVIHPNFGVGVVLNVTGGVVTVVFEDPGVGVKKLAVSIAPLKKVAS